MDELEELDAKMERKETLALSKIPLKVGERHGLFEFEGFVARSRAITCACGAERVECLGVFMREHHERGGFRYTLVKNWPQGKPMRHEMQQVVEPYCYQCVQEMGFSDFEDHGKAAFNPQFKVIEEGPLGNLGTNRIVPRSVHEVLQRFTEKPMTKKCLDADELLDELMNDID